MALARLAPLVILLSLASGCRREAPPTFDGRLEAYLSDLSPRVGGTLAEVLVREGQRVKAGDLLIRLKADELGAAVGRDAASLDMSAAKEREARNGTRAETLAQLRARVADAEAALALATENHGRVRRLAEEKVLGRADLDKAVAERDRALAALDLARKTWEEGRAGLRAEQREAAAADARRARAVLEGSRVQAGFLEIRAPFDGVVVHRLREVGSVVGPGQAVITLAQADRLWVKFYIPQPLQPKVRLGMALEVRTQDGRILPATLDEVASESEFSPKMVETAEERVNLVYPARTHVPQGFDKGLLPGTAVQVCLPAGK